MWRNDGREKKEYENELNSQYRETLHKKKIIVENAWRKYKRRRKGLFFHDK